MKDKLVKNHHKGYYYIIRNIFYSLVIFLSLGAVVAIPTYISIKDIDAKAASTQEEIVEEVEEDTTEKEEELLSYAR